MILCNRYENFDKAILVKANTNTDNNLYNSNYIPESKTKQPVSAFPR